MAALSCRGIIINNMSYIADKKPGELTALTTLATDDVFVVGDTSDASEVAKGITKANLITDLGSSFAAVLGADDNYVTDAEKVVIGNTSGTNSGDNATNTQYSGLAASKLDASAYDDATAAEVNTGTSTAKYVSPDALAGSNLGRRYISCALNGTTALTTSEKYYFRIPAALTGMNLVSVAASVGTGAAGSSSSGTPTFTVKNVTDAQQMLSTSLTVDANEYTSATAATAAVINATYDDVVTDDLIEVACTVAGTGVTYTNITLGWQLP